MAMAFKINSLFRDNAEVTKMATEQKRKTKLMKMAEFKKWMLKKFDEDRDGKLNLEELSEAIRAHGGRFCRFKGWRSIKKYDLNGDGLIDENEMSRLIDFAHKHLNINVVA